MTAFTGGKARLAAFLALIVLPAGRAGEPAAGLRNTDAVTEADGFRLLPAFGEAEPSGSGDLAPPQSIEIIRPDDRPLTLGRIFTSSRAIRVEAAKRSFGPGERALLVLRNLEPTPADGQFYTIYVQLAGPIRATLKFDAFVQSRAPESDLPALTAGTPESGDGPLSGSGPAEADSPAAPPPDAAAIPASIPPVSGETDGGGMAARETPPAAVAGPESAASGQPEPIREAAAPPPAKRDPSLPFVSLITIGVSDMPRAGKFYESVGWRRTSRNPADPAVFFQLNGQALVLYPLPDLLREQNMAAAKPAPGGITLALHVAGKDEVTELYRRFLAAGAAPLREPTEMPSGAVTCYVADLDGNPWEISWVPRFRMDAGGGLWLP